MYFRSVLKIPLILEVYVAFKEFFVFNLFIYVIVKLLGKVGFKKVIRKEKQIAYREVYVSFLSTTILLGVQLNKTAL